MNQTDEVSRMPRVREISVKGLFGTFDHVIPLNLEERVTLVHGLNGFGKTVILQMLADLEAGSFDAIAQIPFHSFRVKLDGGREIELDGFKEVDDWLALSWTEDAGATHCHGVASPEVDYEDLDSRDLLKLNLLATDDLRLSISHILPFVHFVGIDRIYRKKSNRRALGTWVPALSEHSKELVALIEQKQAEFGKLSQTLESSFPTRLIERMGKNGVSDQDIQQRLAAIETTQSLLAKVGVLPGGNQAFAMPAQGLDDSKREVLAIHAGDTERKLAVLEDLGARLNLMMEITNQRFQFKTMTISDQEGLCFWDRSGSSIPLEALSSGEQHHLVMLFHMLFKSRPGSLILIDEPEISLHISWARAFVHDLLKIAALAEIDVLVATHSPNLIHDRWDLTVELKGPA